MVLSVMRIFDALNDKDPSKIKFYNSYSSETSYFYNTKGQIIKTIETTANHSVLGDEYNSDTLSFDKRDIYETQTDFQLKSVQSGTALLHFFKQDMLTNEAINDYLLVTVNNRTGKWEVVDAPDYVFSSLEDEIIEYEEYYDSEYDDYYFIEDEPEVIVLEDNLYFVDDYNGEKEKNE